MLLGAPLLADATPGVALRRRINCALERLRADPHALVLATGGVPPCARCAKAEADAAAVALRAQGIAEGRILIEPTARNTWENAERSARLLRELGIQQTRVLLVTDPWHLPRARLAFRAQGLRASGVSCPAGARPPAWPRLLLKEAVGCLVYLLRWPLAALRGRLWRYHR